MANTLVSMHDIYTKGVDCPCVACAAADKPPKRHIYMEGGHWCVCMSRLSRMPGFPVVARRSMHAAWTEYDELAAYARHTRLRTTYR